MTDNPQAQDVQQQLFQKHAPVGTKECTTIRLAIKDTIETCIALQLAAAPKPEKT